MHTNAKPFIFVIIISIITFVSFSIIIVNFNNTLFKVETYQYKDIDSFDHYNLNRYHYKFNYLDHESNISISKNGDIYSSIQRKVYSPDSPLFRFFNLLFNLSLSYLILILLIPLLLLVLYNSNLMKCNYEIREMIRDGELSAFSIKRKRDLYLSLISVIFLVICGITFGIVVGLPLNLPSYFIKQDRYEHFSDPLCNALDKNSTIGLHHIGKCKTFSGQMVLFNQNDHIYMKYIWGIGEFLTLIRTIVLTTILVGLFLFLLIFIIKYKKIINSYISNQDTTQPSIASVTPIGRSIIVS